jgi:hypothetical protein
VSATKSTKKIEQVAQTIFEAPPVAAVVKEVPKRGRKKVVEVVDEELPAAEVASVPVETAQVETNTNQRRTSRVTKKGGKKYKKKSRKHKKTKKYRKTKK